MSNFKMHIEKRELSAKADTFFFFKLGICANNYNGRLWLTFYDVQQRTYQQIM